MLGRSQAPFAQSTVLATATPEDKRHQQRVVTSPLDPNDIIMFTFFQPIRHNVPLHEPLHEGLRSKAPLQTALQLPRSRILTSSQ